MKSLHQRLNEAETIMQKPSFLENNGLGNEVGYYIFDYLPEDELAVREYITYLQDKFKRRQDGMEIKVFDLYEIMINIIADKGYLEKCFAMEQRKGFDQVARAIGNMLRVTAEDNLIISYIKERIPEKGIIFLTGIGKCYPILRSHSILNNMHQVIDRVPVVMFYPGRYDGQELILFGEIKDDNYYRAFKLVE